MWAFLQSPIVFSHVHCTIYESLIESESRLPIPEISGYHCSLLGTYIHI